MPRIGLKALLRDLSAAGVRRYVKNGSDVEVEFWERSEAQQPTTREDRRERALEEAQAAALRGKELRDPLVVATQELTVDVDEMEN